MLASPQTIFVADAERPVRDAGLVMSAMDIEHRFERTEFGWALVVDAEDQARAHRQLQLYWEENRPSGIVGVTPYVVDSGWPGVVGYLGAIWLLFALTAQPQSTIKALGLLEAGAVVSGEWWRIATALTLHSDLAHIVSNSVFGIVFGLFVGRYIGSGLGWLLVLISASIANLLNAFVQDAGFRALGASTATFAALGLVPAFSWRRGYFKGRGFKRGFAPIFGAICLLTYTGFGGVQIDVLGHVFGFASGIAMGLGVARLNIEGVTTADQQRAGAFTLFLLATAWLFAVL